MMLFNFFAGLLLLCMTTSTLHDYPAFKLSSNAYKSLQTAQSLPYQAHSFNNLDITRHLLNKKVKYFKFDASLANKQSCLTYSTWNNTNACINTSQFAEQMCCIALRGDASSEPNFNYPFNTSREFTTLIDQFLSQHHSQIDILFIAIDFQFNFQFTNTIAEQFLYDLATLMNKFDKLHVSPKGEYVLEFDRVCRFPTDPACTKERSHISGSRFFLQSGSMNPYDSRDYKGRFLNFNIIFTEIDRLCQNGFPAWINKAPHFPLIFWEPSNERQIQSSLSKLMDPKCRSQHNRTLSGIALASNIDPDMFQIAMKKTNVKDLSQQFPWNYKENKVWMENVDSVKLAKIEDENQGERMVLYKKVSANDTVKHFISIMNIPKGQSSVVIQKEIQIQTEIMQLRGVKNTIIAITKDASSSLDSRDYNANLVAYNSQLQITGKLQVEGFISSYSDKNTLYYISMTSNPQVFNIYIVNQTLKKPIQYKVSVFLPRQQIQAISSIYFSRQPRAQDDILLIFGTDVNKTWIAQIINSQEHKIKDIAFGTDARIIEKDNGNIIILLENSYVHGGLLINNNAQNTCMYHKTNSQKPLATVPHMVNALQSSLQNILTFINDDISDQIVTACHPTIKFSKYLNGADLSLVSIWSRLFVSTKFIPIHKQDFITTVFSGGSNFEPTIRNKKGFLIASISANQGFSSNNIKNRIMIQ